MKRKVLAVLLSAAMICTPADVQVFAEEGVTDVYESETQEETQEETSDEKAADEESESGEVQEERSVPETTKAETPDLDGESETAATEVLTEEQTDTWTDVASEAETEEEDIKTLLAEEDIVDSGEIKELSWTIDSTGKLTVTGTGDYSNPSQMQFNDSGSAPWYQCREKITSAEINVSSMTDASYLFEDCINLVTVDLSHFDTDSVNYTEYMFDGCGSLESLELNGFTSVGFADGMFRGCASLQELDLSRFKSDKIRTMGNMFDGCSSLETINLSGLQTTMVDDMSSVFRDCASLQTLDLSGFDTGRVQYMTEMFSGCGKLAELNLRNFNTENVISLDFMFRECSSLTSLDLTNFNMDQVEGMAGIFDGCSSLTSLDLTNFKTNQTEDLSFMFSGCSSLASLDLSGLNTEMAVDMNSMFSGCSSLKNLDLGNFKTDQVKDMSSMFDGCNQLTALNIRNFDTGNVSNMRSMFRGCSALDSLSLENFHTEKVLDMNSMFSGCSSLSQLDLSGFNTGKVTDLSSAFDGCSSLTSLNLSRFSTDRVTNLNFIFDGCGSLESLDLSSWDLSSLQTAENVLSGCDSMKMLYTPRNLTVKIPLSGSWYQLGKEEPVTEFPTGLDDSILITKDVPPVVEEAFIEAMKQKTIYEAGDILNTDDLTVRYYGADGRVLIVTEYTTNSTELDMSQAGEKELRITYKDKDNKELTAVVKLIVKEAGGNIAEGTSQNITWLIDSKGKLTVTGTGDYERKNIYDSPWFDYRRSIKTAEVSVSGMENAADLFSDCNNLIHADLSQFDTSSVTNMSGMFADCSDLEKLDLTNLDTSHVTDMASMFRGCKALNELTLGSHFQTGNVTDMSDMFSGCTSLSEIDLSGFDTGKVIDMTSMFGSCRNLKNLDVSHLNTNHVTSMRGMFMGCSGLTSLDVSTFNTENVTSMESMFGWCSNLSTLNLENINTGKVTDIAGMFSGCGSLTELDLSSFDLSSLTKSAVNDPLYNEPFQDCTALAFLRTPKNCSVDIKLPGEHSDLWYQDKEKTFTMLPAGLDYSIDLYKNAYPGDGTVKEKLTISGITVTDKIYDKQAVTYSGTASAENSAGETVAGLSFDYAYTGTLVNGSTYTSSDKAPSEAGKYTLTVKLHDHEAYTGQKTYSFAISQKELTITASDVSINIGTELPKLDYTVSGLVEGDKLVKEPTLVCGVETTQTAGDYPIIPSDADAGNNYSITYVNGVLKICGLLSLQFDMQGHGNQLSALEVKSGDKVTEPKKPEAEGYTFGGWYKDAACTIAWNFETDTVTADTVLFAKWTENQPDEYMVTFDMQGHGTQILPLTVKDGEKVPKPEDPSAEGYFFEGWYKDAACTMAWDFDTDTVTTYTVLFAKWTENQPDEPDSPYPDEERIDLKPIGAVASVKAKVYDGYPYEPAVKVTVTENGKKKTLTEGADYRVLYHDNTAAGTATVIVRGNGIYKGEITKTFTIKPKSVKKLKIVTGSIALNGEDAVVLPIYIYDGAKLLWAGSDFDQSVNGSLAAMVNKTAKVTITGKGNYTGTVTAKLPVYDAVQSQIIQPENITLKYRMTQYTGKALKDNEPTVKIGDKVLVKNKDYKVQYQNNTNVGNALVIVTGKGAYKGKAVQDFMIEPKSGEEWTIKRISDKTFNGKLQKPAVSGVKAGSKKLVKNRDFTVSYSNNFHAGTARVVLTGKGNYKGQRAFFSFMIKPQKISKVSVKGTMTAGLVVTYNKRILKEGTDYTLEYGAVNKNKIKVTLTGTGDFIGTVTKTVKIQ